MEKNSKFKVGDRVVYTGERYGDVMNGETGTIAYLSIMCGVDKVGVRWDKATKNRHDCDGICAENHGYYVPYDEIKKLAQSIHIYANGPVVTAVLKDGNKAVKTAVARCSPADTFDFDTGAKLAFSRLMGEEPTPEPEKPKLLNCKFVITDAPVSCYGIKKGNVFTVVDGKFKTNDGREFPKGSQVIADWDSLVRYFDGKSEEPTGYSMKFWDEPLSILRIEE